MKLLKKYFIFSWHTNLILLYFSPACPSSLFHTWETLLQDVEIDSQALSEIASIFGRQVSRSLLEKSFHRKIQSRKTFAHRESYETIIARTEEKLIKVSLFHFIALKEIRWYIKYGNYKWLDSFSWKLSTHFWH